MFVRLHKISQRSTGEYYLSHVVVNVSHITYMSEDFLMRQNLTEGRINLELNDTTKFTKIRISSNRKMEEMTVVGCVDFVESKIFKNNESL